MEEVRNDRQLEPSYETLQQENSELKEALACAEKSWRDASQANFLLSSKLKKVQDELDEKVKHLQEECDARDSAIEVWRSAYETVTQSKTWKMSLKVKKLFGRGK